MSVWGLRGRFFAIRFHLEEQPQRAVEDCDHHFSDSMFVCLCSELLMSLVEASKPPKKQGKNSWVEVARPVSCF